MTTRSAALAVGQLNQLATPVVIYQCPVGIVTIVKAINLYLYNATTGGVRLDMRRPAVAAPVVFMQALATAEPVSWNGWHVLEAGDQVRLESDAATVHYWVSGAELVADGANAVGEFPTK